MRDSPNVQAVIEHADAWQTVYGPLASEPSIQSLEGKKIKITGLIELYRGKPEIRDSFKESDY